MLKYHRIGDGKVGAVILCQEIYVVGILVIIRILLELHAVIVVSVFLSALKLQLFYHAILGADLQALKGPVGIE